MQVLANPVHYPADRHPGTWIALSPGMRVTFDATVDEIADAHVRLFMATPGAERDRRVAALLTGGFIATLLFFLLSGFHPIVSAPAALLAGGFGFWQYRREFERVVRRRAGRAVVEQLGEDVPVPTTIDLLPEGLVIEQLGSTHRVEWNRISQLVDRPVGVELRAERPAALLVVRARAFANIVQRAAFVRLARKYLAEAEESAVPLDDLPSISTI